MLFFKLIIVSISVASISTRMVVYDENPTTTVRPKKGGKPKGTTESTFVVKMVPDDEPQYVIPKEYDVPYDEYYNPPERVAETVAYDPPEYYAELVEETVAYDPPEYMIPKEYDVPYDEYYNPPERVAETVAYDPPEYMIPKEYDVPYDEYYNPPERVAETVAYDPPEYYAELVEETVAYDPPEYYAELVEETVAYDPPQYYAELVEETVVYDPPEYYEKRVAETVAYDPPEYYAELVEETVAYDPPEYYAELVEETVAYDPPQYYAELVEETVVYDPPEYYEKRVAETVAYDPPEYYAELVEETVAYDPPQYYAELVEETVAYDPPQYYAELVEETVAYDLRQYNEELGGTSVYDEETVASDVSMTTKSPPTTIATIEQKPSNDIDYMKLLFSDFIEGSDSKIRPVINQSQPIHVHTKFVPINVVQFDTTSQKFSLLAYFRVFWTDEFMNWRPRNYNGLYVMKVPTTDIWKPNLIIQKPYGGDGAIGNEDSDKASISWLGNVQWVPDGTYSVVCDVNIQYYPFDEQVCTISYYMADETYKTLELTHDAEVTTEELSENSAWKVTKLTVNTYIKEDVYYIDVDFHLQRRPNFTTFTLITPLLMLAFLNVCIFLVPADSGEKGGFAITIFLSYGIFISIISDTLPNNSIQTSYFIIFITVLLVLSVLSVFYVILQGKLIACMGIKESLVKCFIPEFMKGKEKTEGAQRSMNQFLNASTPTMNHDDAALAWKLIFQKIDGIIFATFLVIALISTTIFFCIMLRKVSETELNIAE